SRAERPRPFRGNDQLLVPKALLKTHEGRGVLTVKLDGAAFAARIRPACTGYVNDGVTIRQKRAQCRIIIYELLKQFVTFRFGRRLKLLLRNLRLEILQCLRILYRSRYGFDIALTQQRLPQVLT